MKPETLKNIIRNLFLSVATLSLTNACDTMRRIPIETLQPAKVTFEGLPKNIAICTSKTLFSDASASNTEAKLIPVPADSLIENILFSMKYLWKQAPGYDNAQFIVYTASAGDTTVRDFNADITVHLEKLQINNRYYGHQYDYDEWEAYIYINYVAKWAIYNKSGAKIDDYTDSDMVIISSGIHETKAQAVQKLPDAKDAWWDMGIILAKNYIARITPQWQTETRYIYMINKFPDLSMMAYKAMSNDNYIRALNIWETMLMSCRKRGQKQTKSQITYNMAVACEFQNQLEQAITLTKQSSAIKQKNITENYLRLLNNRLEQRKKLDLQTKLITPDS